MKKIIVIMLAVIICNSIFRQQTEPAQPMTKIRLPADKQTQQRTAWLMPGGGSLVAPGTTRYYPAFSLRTN